MLVKVSVGGALNINVSMTDIIDGFIVYHEGQSESSKVMWVVKMEL